MPICNKKCSNCGHTGEFYTNAKRCPKCGEMCLILSDVDQVIEEKSQCDSRNTQDTNMCSYHICRINEGHEGLHECVCGFCWEEE